MKTPFADEARLADHGATAVRPCNRTPAGLRAIRDAGDDLA